MTQSMYLEYERRAHDVSVGARGKESKGGGHARRQPVDALGVERERREAGPERDERALGLARLEQLEVLLLFDQEARLLLCRTAGEGLWGERGRSDSSSSSSRASGSRPARQLDRDRPARRSTRGQRRRTHLVKRPASDADRAEQADGLLPPAAADGRAQVVDGRKVEREARLALERAGRVAEDGPRE